MSTTQFRFADSHKHVVELGRRLHEQLKNSPDEKVQELMRTMPTFDQRYDTFGKKKAQLIVAFVGQYDSGKSTMISALTDNKEIPIDADVCTNEVAAYDWYGISILDTPGIHAGYPEHDERTYAAIDKADLLVFVITNELFDDVIGKHFRELCFEKNKASETLLVVNKMGQDPGTPEIKIPDIASVTQPKSPGDFRTTFIDALSYLEATEEEDDRDRNELFDIANFNSFVDALNGFVRDNGLMGRLTTPLFEMRAIAQQAEAFLSVDMPEKRAAIELLNRKRILFLHSRSRLRVSMNGIVSEAASGLIAIGDTVAEAIEPGASEEFVQAKHEAAQQEAKTRCGQLAEDAQKAIGEELSELQSQLEALENSLLAKELREQVTTATEEAKETRNTDVSNAEIHWEGQEETTPSDWPKRFKKVGKVTDSLGKYTANWAAGPELAEGAKIGTATATKGSQAHVFVYKAGKYFGVKFKPWGAVKVARAIGNAGRVIAAVGGVLAVVAQILEDKQADQYKIKLREARDSIRIATENLCQK